MTVRTLAEAAAEILAKSRSSAAEPMKKGPGNAHDLGGSTHEKPQGDENPGAKAAALVAGSTPPGTKPDASSKEGMKKLASKPENNMGSPKTSPEEEYNNVSTAGHGYMKPTVSEEEIVAEDEEVIAEEEISEEDVEEIVSEEEVSENVAEELTEEEYAEILEAKKAMIKQKMCEMGCKEDIDALFNGEDLSEDFRLKATTIFEAAVIARAIPVVEELETEILAAAEESISEIKAELEEQIDTYLNYMVDEWINENKIAIESGLKHEIMEDLFDGLKNLLVNNNINLPEEKMDAVEAMAEEVEELQNKLNDQMNLNVELSKRINEAKKINIVSSVCEGLTATQAEKVKTLAEGVEFTTEGEYTKKIGIIRGNYFVSENANKVKQAEKNPIALTESEEPVKVEEISSSMSRYVNALSRTTPR